MKPLGYYVAPPKNSQFAPYIERLEELYGSFFQRLDKGQLMSILSFCSLAQETPDNKANADQIGLILQAYLWDKKIEILKHFYSLPKNILFKLIPFLHQVIEARQ
ncbi:hypothetical protein A0J48_006930 [Sphaerospermopsis aphanizomenoides BCCUSP55]|uniref:hypothetical protein n=1 Tax=Sphaerospermopsis aphanizomenoides TaxID=459663 RepID=UPI001907116D|nr:hypothetical protein [Sphaerospermopsis aphanizomenoides]MBK1987270.1 hypothetical protein [Sphaerospermopsis aphanizomenoides BCCUSP55]